MKEKQKPEVRSPQFRIKTKTVSALSFWLLNSDSCFFPQKLWKSLWKSGLAKLQVLENFKLLAFCTHTLQFFKALTDSGFRL